MGFNSAFKGLINIIIATVYCPSAFVRASKLNTVTNVIMGVSGGAVG
jgi:hypothetical protein